MRFVQVHIGAFRLFTRYLLEAFEEVGEDFAPPPLSDVPAPTQSKHSSKTALQSPTSTKVGDVPRKTAKHHLK